MLENLEKHKIENPETINGGVFSVTNPECFNNQWFIQKSALSFDNALLYILKNVSLP